jgi:hypothetical protein
VIKHVLKITWHTKRQYAGILVEQGLVMFVLMFCMVIFAKTIKQLRDPGILNVDNTFICLFAETDPNATTEISKKLDAVTDHLRRLPYVEHVSYNRNLAPFINSNNLMDSIRVDDKTIGAVIKASDEHGAAVFHPVMEEGRWIENSRLPDGTVPVVISRQFAEKAGWSQGTGKKFQYRSFTCTVVGVTSGLKSELAWPSPAAAVIPTSIEGEAQRVITVRVKRNSKADFYDTYCHVFKQFIPPDMAEPAIVNLEEIKQGNSFGTKFHLLLLGLPTAFLTIFAFVGTFGLFWSHARQSFKEFALRMALGSTRKQLIYFVIVQSLLVTLIAMLPALALAAAIYDYTGPQVTGVAVAAGCMLLFSVVSTWYPAWKVSRVNPAETLQHE